MGGLVALAILTVAPLQMASLAASPIPHMEVRVDQHHEASMI